MVCVNTESLRHLRSRNAKQNQYFYFNLRNKGTQGFIIYKNKRHGIHLEFKHYFLARPRDRKVVIASLATENLEILCEGFIFAYAKFRENKILVKWRDHSVVD